MANWRKTLTNEHRLEKGKGGGGGGASLNAEVANVARQGTFKPFTISTSGGTAFGKEGEFGAAASPEFQQAQQSALAGVNQLLPSIAGAFGRETTPFEFNTNADQLTQNYFAQQMGTLAPQFEQQRQQLKGDLFGSGRLGLSLAGSAVGAGEGTMVNPDAFGLAQAQSNAMVGAYNQARQNALADAQQRYALESGVYNINQAAEQQRAQNLLAGATGLFGLGTGVTDQELAILSGGLTGEQVRGASYTDAAAAMAAGSQQRQSSGGKGLLGSAIGAGAQLGAASIMASSDARLKTNIQYDTTDANGIHWYTWDWNTTAKELGLAGDSTYGVIAQEVMEIMPEAVVMYPDGYYRVNYELITKAA